MTANVLHISSRIMCRIALAVGLFLLSCSERDRTNIFDPENNIDSLDLSIFISSADSIITLKWYAPPTVSFKAYNLYRKTGSDENFSLRATIDKKYTQFADRIAAFDTEHQYYLRLVGENSLSPPSPAISTIPGPGTFWLLDRWDFNISHLTYDLKHRISTQFAVWTPQEMCFDSQFRYGLVTYPQYHYAEVIELTSGEITNGIDNIDYPYACTYDADNNQFWITDSAGALYRAVANGQDAQLISDQFQKPTQIRKGAGNNIYILDRKLNSIHVFTPDGTLSGTILDEEPNLLQNPSYIEVSPNGEVLYIIDMGDETNTLYRYFPANGQAEVIASRTGMMIVRPDPTNDGSVWIAVNGESASDIMQLSPTGLRLNFLEGFDYVQDFLLSPYTGNLVVIDSGKRIVQHIRQDGSLVGTFSRGLFPFKVYNQ